jgi:hypothetical protein
VPGSGMRTATVVTCTSNRRPRDHIRVRLVPRTAGHAIHTSARLRRTRSRVFREKGNARQGGDRRGEAGNDSSEVLGGGVVALT